MCVEEVFLGVDEDDEEEEEEDSVREEATEAGVDDLSPLWPSLEDDKERMLLSFF